MGKRASDSEQTHPDSPSDIDEEVEMR